MKQIIFATGNSGKMKEIREILRDLDVEVLSMKEAGIQIDIVEDGNSFSENAMIKAKAIAQYTDRLVLADDSGLEIDYLDKEPGIYSARYMGEETSYHIKNNNLIQRLDNVERDKRTARFICAIAAVFPNKETAVTEAAIEGYIGYEEQGTDGFGYDPIFMIPEYNKTAAQLTPQEKNKISHRGKALEKMKEQIKNR